MSAPLGVSDITGALANHTATDPASAFGFLQDIVVAQLMAPNWQIPITVLAAVAGLAMLLQPKPAFKYIMIGTIFSMIFTITMGILHKQFPGQGHLMWEPVVAVEFGLVVAWVANKGFDGVEIIVAMSMGFKPMLIIKDVFVSNSILGNSPWWNVVIVTVSFVSGFFISQDHRLEAIMGVVFPIIGGKLFSASLGWGAFVAGSLAEHGHQSAWLDFWHSLPFDFNDPVVTEIGFQQQVLGSPGIGWSTPTDLAPGWVGTVLGALIWIVMSSVAVYKTHQAVDRKRKSLSAPPPNPERVKELQKALKTPLLEHKPPPTRDAP